MFYNIPKSISSSSNVSSKIESTGSDNLLSKKGNSIKTTYHLYAVKHLGGVSYEIKNKEEGDTKKAIELMEKSVESLKLIK